MDKYYRTLQVPIGSSIEVVKNSYRKLALKYHPDKYSQDSETFLEIQSAYDALLQRRDSEDDITLHPTTIGLDEMEQSESIYMYDCRCGQVFRISQEELDAGYRVIECEGCSCALEIDIE